MPSKPNTDNFQPIPILPSGPAVIRFVLGLFILGISLKKPVQFIKELFFPLFLSARKILEDLGPSVFFRIIPSCVLQGLPERLSRSGDTQLALQQAASSLKPQWLF